MVTFATFQSLAMFQTIGFIWAVCFFSFLIEQYKCGCYTMVAKITWISVLKTGLCVSEMHMGNCEIATILRHIAANHFEEMSEAFRYMNGNELFIHMLNQVDERYLFLRTFQFEILLVYFLILFDCLLPAVRWISPLRHTGLLCQGLGLIVWWLFRCCLRVCFTKNSFRVPWM